MVTSAHAKFLPAVQIGLTATPRQLDVPEDSPQVRADLQISADNLKYFGEPVYEYDMSQGIEDGYLAACEIIRRDIFLDDKPHNEREGGIDQGDLSGKTLIDARTGETLDLTLTRRHDAAAHFEDQILLPDRVAAMTRDLFAHLLATSGPEQKTIIFCARDSHADAVAIAMNNLYTAWCTKEGKKHVEFYAFKCTAASSGNDYLADLRGASRSHFIATTVDLLTTGVDVPRVNNIVFFKYVRSPISFYQMVGRGTRLDPPTGKLMFRVYDYTNATRLFGEDFITAAPSQPKPPGEPRPDRPERPRERTISVAGFDVHVTDAGRYIVTQVDGKAMPVTVEEYKERLAAKLVEEAPTPEDFRSLWIVPSERKIMLGQLPDGGRSAFLVRSLEGMDDYDLYDVLAELGYGLNPRTRVERADGFAYKNVDWLEQMPEQVTNAVKAIASQFARSGTDGLENPQIFQVPGSCSCWRVGCTKGRRETG